MTVSATHTAKHMTVFDADFQAQATSINQIAICRKQPLSTQGKPTSWTPTTTEK